MADFGYLPWERGYLTVESGLMRRAAHSLHSELILACCHACPQPAILPSRLHVGWWVGSVLHVWLFEVCHALTNMKWERTHNGWDYPIAITPCDEETKVAQMWKARILIFNWFYSTDESLNTFAIFSCLFHYRLVKLLFSFILKKRKVLIIAWNGEKKWWGHFPDFFAPKTWALPVSMGGWVEGQVCVCIDPQAKHFFLLQPSRPIHNAIFRCFP